MQSFPRFRTGIKVQEGGGKSDFEHYCTNLRDDDLFVCGERESVHHVLLDCPRLGTLRRELLGKVGDAFNSISTLLGGPGEEGRGLVRVTTLHGPRQLRLSWTSLKHGNVFKAARHEGSMNITTVQKPRHASARPKVRLGSDTRYMYLERYI